MMRKEIEARENEELEKIVELFEKVKNKKHMIQFMAYEPRFVEIIKWLKGYLRIKKGGWIPPEERLPEECETVLVWFAYFRYGNYNRMYQTYGLSYVIDGKWSGFINGSTGWKRSRIIAWMPLPVPYNDGKFGHCRLKCLKLKPEKPCCMYCTEADSCEDKCEDMNEYQYAGECPDYIEKEE